MMRFVWTFSAICLVATAWFTAPPTRAVRWPQVTPVHEKFSFPNAWRANAATEIKGTDGAPLYRLQCYGEHADRSRFDTHPDALYGGEFDCHLYELSLSSADTLLIDGTLPGGEAYARSIVDSTELVGACANYPEYGLVRHFLLRGMKITFTYSRVKTKKELTSSGAPYPPGTPRIALPELISFDFAVDVVPDPGALSEIAAPAPFATPPPKKTANPYINLPDCSKVVLRN